MELKDLALAIIADRRQSDEKLIASLSGFALGLKQFEQKLAQQSRELQSKLAMIANTLGRAYGSE